MIDGSIRKVDGKQKRGKNSNKVTRESKDKSPIRQPLVQGTIISVDDAQRATFENEQLEHEKHKEEVSFTREQLKEQQQDKERMQQLKSMSATSLGHQQRLIELTQFGKGA